MDVVNERCCGLDIHKKTISACVNVSSRTARRKKQLRVFGTMTCDLLALADWLNECGVTHVAMEATGVYWKPVWNILEGHVPEMLLVNAQHVKAVPGRKTDQKDAEWLADLLQHGLLRSSFIPPVPIRELRDLTRLLVSVVEDLNRVTNRIQKVLEDANIKLASVASDTVGASGRAMLDAIVAGHTEAEELAEMARGKLRRKLPELRTALHGKVTDHHRFLLQQLLAWLRFLEEQLNNLEAAIARKLAENAEQIDRLCSIPGVDRITASGLVAEIGLDMTPFPSAHHLASWAGLCPGNCESAGKRLNGTTRKGSPAVRRCLCQAAWAVAKTRNNYLSALFHRIASRRGSKRAVIPVAHAILIAAYYILKRQQQYRELGGDYFDRLNVARIQRALVRRLERLGKRRCSNTGSTGRLTFSKELYERVCWSQREH
jgi:transposase